MYCVRLSGRVGCNDLLLCIWWERIADGCANKAFGYVGTSHVLKFRLFVVTKTYHMLITSVNVEHPVGIESWDVSQDGLSDTATGGLRVGDARHRTTSSRANQLMLRNNSTIAPREIASSWSINNYGGGH